MASKLTSMSWGLAIAPLSSSSSNFCCNSTSRVFGYHGTSFSLADGGRALGMFMTASTFPKVPLYFGKSGPKTFPNSLHMSENCCLISGGKRAEVDLNEVWFSLSLFYGWCCNWVFY